MLSTTPYHLKAFPKALASATQRQDNNSYSVYNEKDNNAMAIQGVYLEPVRIHTGEFKEFDQRFGNKLVTMYEINYAEVVNGYLGNEDEWDDTTYYHGTSHCGCLDKRIVNPENNRVPVYAWCENALCSTRSIINSGFLKTKSPRGHFFSPQVDTSRLYATNKGQSAAPNSSLLSVFICVTRNPQNANLRCFEDYHSVQNDNDILPVYIAIVRK